MNPFSAALAGLSPGSAETKGMLWAYLRSREASYSSGYTAAAGNPFDWVCADAKALMGDSWATTYILQQFGHQRVYK
ncbi:hypothetical protein PLANPX_3828 [Lacipirellula parvula]|uniref:Uncharacterized protein n=1 Tax=Lacipirellula parvula TaxID=2650471 RepID=A0A5K7XIP4_9BACT|nr:hypothetical protein PLANPX_3828 [Lacipirellula parvula]